MNNRQDQYPPPSSQSSLGPARSYFGRDSIRPPLSASVSENFTSTHGSGIQSGREPILNYYTTTLSFGENESGPRLPVKHKRTRFGCFKCRERRIKCDETKPICNRCQIGNRVCEYPDSTSTQKSESVLEGAEVNVSSSGEGSPNSKRRTVSGGRTASDSSREFKKRPSRRTSIKPAEKSAEEPTSRQVRRLSEKHSDLALDAESSVTTSPRHGQDPLPKSTPARDNLSHEKLGAKWRRQGAILDSDAEFYLIYHREYITYHHYMLKIDPTDFIHEELIELAFQYEPLLLAVLAFSAYLYAIRHNTEKAMFDYYTRAIEILAKQGSQLMTINGELSLLTILQIATLQEYLGDWTKVLIHQKSAHRLLIDIFPSGSLMRTSRSRTILNWFSRFDVIASLIAVQSPMLDQSYISDAVDWYRVRTEYEQTGVSPNAWLFILLSLRLAGYAIARIFAFTNAAKAEFEKAALLKYTFEELQKDVTSVRSSLEILSSEIRKLHPPDLPTGNKIVFRQSRDDIFAPVMGYFNGDLQYLNFIWQDWYGLNLMLEHQTALAQRKFASIAPIEPSKGMLTYQPSPVSSYLQNCAEAQCRIYQGIEADPDLPEAAVLSCIASIGFSCIFLPKAPPESNNKYTMWARQKMAKTERLGYLLTIQYRQKMAQLWQAPEVEDWWLPDNDEDPGKPTILKTVREMVRYDDETTLQLLQQTGDLSWTDLRDMKGMFEKLGHDEDDKNG